MMGRRVFIGSFGFVVFIIKLTILVYTTHMCYVIPFLFTYKLTHFHVSPSPLETVELNRVNILETPPSAVSLHTYQLL